MLQAAIWFCIRTKSKVSHVELDVTSYQKQVSIAAVMDSAETQMSEAARKQCARNCESCATLVSFLS